MNRQCNSLASLKNRVAIVTGASRGIGKAITRAYCEAGVKVVMVSLQDEMLEKAWKEMKESAVSVSKISGDVAKPETSKRAVEAALALGGSVDILVNCAGTISRENLEETSNESWGHVLGVNLTGSFYNCREVLPHMRKRKRGKIINITSQMAFMPHPGASPSYEVSKAGLTALTRHIALHYARYGICANSIAPGSIDTDMPKSMPKEARTKLKAGIPLLRLGETTEVSDLALFLACDSSNYITGQTIAITGGSLMR